MDAVLAAADIGCFASYIEKQGGVLIPRERYTVRIAYEDAQEQNEYGETPEKIFGVFSPRLGELFRICTRLAKWKIRKKQASDAGANDSTGCGLAVTPPTGGAWSSVNNSTGDEKIDIPERLNGDTCTRCDQPDGEIGRTSEQENIDFDHMTDKKRRALLNRLRTQPPDRRYNYHSATTQLPESREKQTVSKRSDDCARILPMLPIRWDGISARENCSDWRQATRSRLPATVTWPLLMAVCTAPRREGKKLLNTRIKLRSCCNGLRHYERFRSHNRLCWPTHRAQSEMMSLKDS